jgi:protein-S-isoprenylcysteine O-methyltransferase Ste14
MSPSAASKSPAPHVGLPHSRLFNHLGQIVVVLLYLNFSVLYALHYTRTHNLSLLFYALYSTVVLVFLFIRRHPKAASDSVWYWAAAMGGTFIDLLMRPYPSHAVFSYWLVPQIIGIIISFAGLLSLNRGFGIMVGNRGIHTGGMYRLVRHPLYAGYFLTNLSFWAQHLSFWNSGVLVSFCILQVVRVYGEEKFLAADRAYVEYAKRTKWRILPGVW